MLRSGLDALYAQFNADRAIADPVWMARRYEGSEDREVVAFIAAALAFGRLQSVLNLVDGMLKVMGSSPASFVRNFDPARDRSCFKHLVHRWTNGADFAALVWTLHQMIAQRGSIEQFSVDGLAAEAVDVGDALQSFSTRALKLDVTGAAPVAIVNEPFVRKFLGGRNPIGRRIRVDTFRDDRAAQPWREIVGVVPDLGLSVGDKAMAAGSYVPARDERLWYLVLRTASDPLTLAGPLRAAIANVDPDLQLEDIRTLEAAGQEDRVFLTGVATALTAMGGMALALSIVGIDALLSFMVSRRTREIGIRVALGAANWQVVRSITAGAAVYLVLGGVLGSALGMVFVQMRSLILISIPAPGVWMPSTIFLTLAIAGLTACWLPGRRALRIRPAEALSAD